MCLEEEEDKKDTQTCQSLPPNPTSWLDTRTPSCSLCISTSILLDVSVHCTPWHCEKTRDIFRRNFIVDFHVICISLFFSCARNAAAACLHFHHLASHCTQNLADIQLVWDARCNAHQPHRLDCGEHWRRWRSAKLDTCISLCAGMIFTHHLF